MTTLTQPKRKFELLTTANALGALGILFSIIATQTIDPFIKQCFFLAGAAPILLAAIVAKHRLFTSLEVVIFVGVILGFFPLSPWISGGIPIAMSAALGVWFVKEKRIHSFNDWIGILSLVALALGFAMKTPGYYFAGSVIGFVYSVLEVRDNVPEAWVWVILNGIFAVAVLFEIFY